MTLGARVLGPGRRRGRRGEDLVEHGEEPAHLGEARGPPPLSARLGRRTCRVRDALGQPGRRDPIDGSERLSDDRPREPLVDRAPPVVAVEQRAHLPHVGGGACSLEETSQHAERPAERLPGGLAAQGQDPLGAPEREAPLDLPRYLEHHRQDVPERHLSPGGAIGLLERLGGDEREQGEHRVCEHLGGVQEREARQLLGRRARVGGLGGVIVGVHRRLPPRGLCPIGGGLGTHDLPAET
jgi:hypothetical protein